MSTHNEPLSIITTCVSEISNSCPFLFALIWQPREHKRRQLFICTHDETLSVAAVRIDNPDCSPLEIHG